MFLFQIGAIKSSRSLMQRCLTLRFLFQIGAIKSHYKALNSVGNIIVSIPNWCD